MTGWTHGATLLGVNIPDEPLDWKPRDTPLGPPAAPAPAFGAPQIPPTQPPPRRRLYLIIGVVVLAVLVGAGIVTFAATRKPPVPKVDVKASAIAACEGFVKSQLKAPATAKFSDEQVIDGPTGGYQVSGAIDAENGFGALVRGHFRCLAVQISGRWTDGGTHLTEG